MHYINHLRLTNHRGTVAHRIFSIGVRGVLYIRQRFRLRKVLENGLVYTVGGEGSQDLMEHLP